MASPKNEGFLTEEQREVLKMAAQGAEVLSSSPRTASKLLAENHMKTAAAGGAGGRYVRRTHSGKLGRVKKDNCMEAWTFKDASVTIRHLQWTLMGTSWHLLYSAPFFPQAWFGE